MNARTAGNSSSITGPSSGWRAFVRMTAAGCASICFSVTSSIGSLRGLVRAPPALGPDQTRSLIRRSSFRRSDNMASIASARDLAEPSCSAQCARNRQRPRLWGKPCLWSPNLAFARSSTCCCKAPWSRSNSAVLKQESGCVIRTDHQKRRLPTAARSARRSCDPKTDCGVHNWFRRSASSHGRPPHD